MYYIMSIKVHLYTVFQLHKMKTNIKSDQYVAFTFNNIFKRIMEANQHVVQTIIIKNILKLFL